MSVWDLNLVSGGMVVFMMIFVIWGYIPLISFRGREWQDYMVRGTVIAFTAIMLRMVYWDMTRYLPHMNWATFRDRLGGVEINVLFNGLVMLAIYQYLKGRLLLIPEEHRDEYVWWNSWKYPSRRCPLLMRHMRRRR